MIRVIRYTILATATALATVVGIISGVLAIYSAFTPDKTVSIINVIRVVTNPEITIAIDPELEQQLLEAARRYNAEGR